MNLKELKGLLALGEGFTTEFKSSGTSNLGRETCTFVNTGGMDSSGHVDPISDLLGMEAAA